MRVHQARKRVLLIVWTCIRFRRGLRIPQRMRRCDSFSYYIPLLLADSYHKFVDEQSSNCMMRQELDSMRVGSRVLGF